MNDEEYIQVNKFNRINYMLSVILDYVRSLMAFKCIDFQWIAFLRAERRSASQNVQCENSDGQSVQMRGRTCSVVVLKFHFIHFAIKYLVDFHPMTLSSECVLKTSHGVWNAPRN